MKSAFAAIVSGGLAFPAVAADIPMPGPAPEPAPLAIEGVSFSFTGYLWAAGLTGTTASCLPCRRPISTSASSTA